MAATWTVLATGTDPTNPELKELFHPREDSRRRNFKGQEAISRTHSEYTGGHFIIIFNLTE